MQNQNIRNQSMKQSKTSKAVSHFLNSIHQAYRESKQSNTSHSQVAGAQRSRTHKRYSRHRRGHSKRSIQDSHEKEIQFLERKLFQYVEKKKKDREKK